MINATTVAGSAAGLADASGEYTEVAAVGDETCTADPSRDRNDPKSGLASSNHTTSYNKLVRVRSRLYRSRFFESKLFVQYFSKRTIFAHMCT